MTDGIEGRRPVARVAEERQMTLGALVGVVALAAALVARNLFQGFLWSSLGPASIATTRATDATTATTSVRSVVMVMMMMQIDTVMEVRLLLAMVLAAVLFLADVLLTQIGWHLVAVDGLVATLAAKVAGYHDLLALFGLEVLDGW